MRKKKRLTYQEILEDTSLGGMIRKTTRPTRAGDLSSFSVQDAADAFALSINSIGPGARDMSPLEIALLHELEERRLGPRDRGKPLWHDILHKGSFGIHDTTEKRLYYHYRLRRRPGW